MRVETYEDHEAIPAAAIRIKPGDAFNGITNTTSDDMWLDIASRFVWVKSLNMDEV